MIKHGRSLWILACVFMVLVIGCGTAGKIPSPPPTPTPTATPSPLPPSEQLEKMFQEMETLYQRDKYDAMLELTRQSDLLIARNSELEKEEYRVWYYKAKAYMGKARQSKSESDFQGAFSAINKSIELARVLAEADKLNEEQLRPLVQVYLDTAMVGAEILIAQDEYDGAYKLIQELKNISEQTGMYPVDMTPAYQFAELLYSNAQMNLIAFYDEEAKTNPDISRMNLLMQQITKSMLAANMLFDWAAKNNPDYSQASILCVRLHFYWSAPEYYFEDCKDRLPISSTQTVPQITANESIESKNKLLFKAIVYLDASDARVLLKNNFGTLLQTKWGTFYLSDVETDVPVKLIGRFYDVLSIPVGGVVRRAVELEILAIKKG